MFLPWHENDTARDTAVMIWNRFISHTGLVQNIISDRDPKFTSSLWTNLHNLFGKHFSFTTAYHNQTDGLAEEIIQNLEDIIIGFCAYVLELKDSDFFTHDQYTLIPSLELAYNTSIHLSSGKTSAMLEKVWNPRVPYDTLKKDLFSIHPKARSFNIMLEKERHHADKCMQDLFKYEKEGWDKSHKPPDLQVGDLVLVSNQTFSKIKGENKPKYFFSGPSMRKSLHGPDAVQLELTGELMNKHPAFPVILIKPFS
ncbi:hypothetical protein O181_052828 [Austropuccinia psidii MF-1]|uniref:Integrase catalytic domain-containing protein n=1 Tax=Austropuccinia psidii MF-1 TaxID=1389203 RepID=A0A9Q3HPU2_9BASI|nr:hypothetical protein [Austropuccinia psidii MF-1]